MLIFIHVFTFYYSFYSILILTAIIFTFYYSFYYIFFISRFCFDRIFLFHHIYTIFTIIFLWYIKYMKNFLLLYDLLCLLLFFYFSLILLSVFFFVVSSYTLFVYHMTLYLFSFPLVFLFCFNLYTKKVG